MTEEELAIARMIDEKRRKEIQDMKMASESKL
jgi:hypothetical protein